MQDDNTGNFFELTIDVNLFRENQAAPLKINVNGKVNKLVVEVSPKLVKSITTLIPEFFVFSRMKLIKPMKEKLG